MDAQGNVAYDAIAKRGHGSNQIVQAQFKDLVPLHERADVGDISLSRPSEDVVQETADRTRAALEKISKCKSFSSFVSFFVTFILRFQVIFPR